MAHYGRVVAVTRKVFSLQEHDGSKLVDDNNQDIYEEAEEVSEGGHGAGQRDDTGADDSLHDGGDCEHEI